MKAMSLIGVLLAMAIAFSGCATSNHSVLIDSDKSDAYASGQYSLIGQGYTDPVRFARAMALINYSKRLKTVSYDSSGAIVGYEFEGKPMASKTGYHQTPSQSKVPSSFGHQPIE